jgi:hypothetical protein
MKPERENNEWVNHVKCLVSCVGELRGSDCSEGTGKDLLAHERQDAVCSITKQR